MVRSIPTQISDHFCSIPLAIGLFATISAIVALCANHARKKSRKEVVADNFDDAFSSYDDQKFPPRSPLRSPRQLITTISNKAMNPFSMFNNKKGDSGELFEVDDKGGNGGFEEEGGLWQKGILMGEKCQPPEFSGVIYYDYDGNKISELPPRSPRANFLPTTFSFPVMVNE